MTDVTVCARTSDGQLLKGSGTLGICLGTSSERYKTGIVDLADGLPQILALRPRNFYLDAAHGDPNKLGYGFIAEEAVNVLPHLVGLDGQGRPNTFDYLGVVPVLVKGEQELNARIDDLAARVAAFETDAAHAAAH